MMTAYQEHCHITADISYRTRNKKELKKTRCKIFFKSAFSLKKQTKKICNNKSKFFSEQLAYDLSVKLQLWVTVFQRNKMCAETIPKAPRR